MVIYNIYFQVDVFMIKSIDFKLEQSKLEYPWIFQSISIFVEVLCVCVISTSLPIPLMQRVV